MGNEGSGLVVVQRKGEVLEFSMAFFGPLATLRPKGCWRPKAATVVTSLPHANGFYFIVYFDILLILAH